MSSRRRASNFIRDFKSFINKGNVVDLAIAVIIGGAFGKVVNALVTFLTDKLLHPLMTRLHIEQIGEWPAGELLVAVINFILISFVVFVLVQSLENFKRKAEVEETLAAEATPEKPDPQLQLAEAANRLAQAIEQRKI
ncbi:MAG: large conductance mechanosensitive channel protein MscL [Prochlorococcus sp.]|nr:large conductance mechanosensitive channel protein MscL [Prochlorococcaceae cyanobacterium Fu_MAG_50]